ncbi:phosphohistidine phosphatase [Neisseria sp. HSC-16F19]|nr:histidine phosphatase family protein [Neisseria sp. HSC-16F19]MCP2041625.1 phosphohistidine phosphatase [Neisseria sp. HSC-16F19]
MHIILWRHAEAEPGFNDLARRLTDKGRKQARCSASWLKRHLPPGYRLWISEAVRSRETAEYLRRADQVQPLINPEADPQRIAELLRVEHDSAALVLVGHQPWIGQLCAWLLNDGQWQPHSYWSVKKSAFWWFEVHFDTEGRPSAKLKGALPPAWLADE